jgi:hypothetical protein
MTRLTGMFDHSDPWLISSGAGRKRLSVSYMLRGIVGTFRIDTNYDYVRSDIKIGYPKTVSQGWIAVAALSVQIMWTYLWQTATPLTSCVSSCLIRPGCDPRLLPSERIHMCMWWSNVRVVDGQVELDEEQFVQLTPEELEVGPPPTPLQVQSQTRYKAPPHSMHGWSQCSKSTPLSRMKW